MARNKYYFNEFKKFHKKGHFSSGHRVPSAAHRCYTKLAKHVKRYHISTNCRSKIYNNKAISFPRLPNFLKLIIFSVDIHI